MLTEISGNEMHMDSSVVVSQSTVTYSESVEGMDHQLTMEMQGLGNNAGDPQHQIVGGRTSPDKTGPNNKFA